MPTENAYDITKNAFYVQLQYKLDSAPHHSSLMLPGDLNAQIGNSWQSFEQIVGPYESARKKNDMAHILMGSEHTCTQ